MIFSLPSSQNISTSIAPPHHTTPNSTLLLVYTRTYTCIIHTMAGEYPPNTDKNLNVCTRKLNAKVINKRFRNIFFSLFTIYEPGVRAHVKYKQSEMIPAIAMLVVRFASFIFFYCRRCCCCCYHHFRRFFFCIRASLSEHMLEHEI